MGRTRAAPSSLAAALAWGTLLATPTAFADTPGWQVNQPYPSLPGDGFVWTASGRVADTKRGASASLQWVERPVGAFRPDAPGDTRKIQVDRQIWGYIGAAWNVVQEAEGRAEARALVGIDVPVLVSQTPGVARAGRAVARTGDVGDVRLSLRVHAFRVGGDCGATFAALTHIWAPTGATPNFGGDYGFRFEQRVGGDLCFGRAHLHLDGGVNWATATSPVVSGIEVRNVYQGVGASAARWRFLTGEAGTLGTRPFIGPGVVWESDVLLKLGVAFPLRPVHAGTSVPWSMLFSVAGTLDSACLAAGGCR